jgi:diacylglycerol kinase (ATP)
VAQPCRGPLRPKPAPHRIELGRKGFENSCAGAGPAYLGGVTRTALLLVNNRSRRGGELLKAAQDRLKSNGIEPVHRECGSREEMRELILEHGPGMDLVAVGGGDGTLNAAALGVHEIGLPLGVLPMGTANDLARTLGIPPNLDAAARVIAQGRTKRIDLGLVNGEPFFNVASLGLSVELARTLTGDLKKRFGRLGYAVAAVGALSRARPFRAIIRSERESVRVRTLQIAVGNGRYYGGGNAVEKSAAIDDQHLDLYSLELTRAWKLALMARSFRYGEHGAWDEVRAIRAKEFDVITTRPRPVNADGEIVTHTPAHFRIVPNAVTVFAP